jgi:hypothetical protein
VNAGLTPGVFLTLELQFTQRAASIWSLAEKMPCVGRMRAFSGSSGKAGFSISILMKVTKNNHVRYFVSDDRNARRELFLFGKLTRRFQWEQLRLFIGGAGLLFFVYAPQELGAQWYKAPTDGQVTFTLTQFWMVVKGPANENAPMGDASITIGYSSGATDLIVFQSSGQDIYEALEHTGYINGEGTLTWTQAASIPPGTEFQILSNSPAQAYDPTKAFEGGQEGAYVHGITTNVSTNAPQSNSGGSGPSSPNLLPPPPSAPGGAPANIHAVIISGLSDPAKVVVSSNVTLTGGIIALGKNGSPPSAWSPGLKIIPDYALLTGEKIPPVTPNIIDVRIVRQEVSADFPSPSASPNN